MFEHERRVPFLGWRPPKLRGDPENFCDANGRPVSFKDPEPMPGYKFTDNWTIDMLSEPTDPEGWRYALNFTDKFHTFDKFFRNVRRRRWIRHMQYFTYMRTASLREHTGLFRFETVEFWENQRRRLNGHYTAKRMLHTDPPLFSNKEGTIVLSSKSLDEAAEQNPNCCWKSEWQVDSFSAENGWFYGYDFKSDLHTLTCNTAESNDFIHRRRWIQLRQIEITRPAGCHHALTWTFRSMRKQRAISSSKALSHQESLSSKLKHQTSMRKPTIFDAWALASKSFDFSPPQTMADWVQAIDDHAKALTVIAIDVRDRCARYESQLRGDTFWHGFSTIRPSAVLNQILENLVCITILANRIKQLPMLSSMDSPSMYQSVIDAFMERAVAEVAEHLHYIDSADDHSEQVSLLLFIHQDQLAKMKQVRQEIRQIRQGSSIYDVTRLFDSIEHRRLELPHYYYHQVQSKIDSYALLYCIL